MLFGFESQKSDFVEIEYFVYSDCKNAYNFAFPENADIEMSKYCLSSGCFSAKNSSFK